ncbi:RNA-directed DNA polymerase, eukaryota [Tanacetum coccineum]
MNGRTTINKYGSDHGETTPHQQEESVTRDIIVFTYSDLKLATRNFSVNRRLGFGFKGTVYRGWVDNITYPSLKNTTESPIAVRELSHYKHFDLELFKQFRHPNVAQLIGYCINNRNLFLVYEYMCNRNLKYLLRQGVVAKLPLATKIKIAVGIARGIVFLKQAQLRVLDIRKAWIKRKKIYLDEDFMPKISGYEFPMLAQGFFSHSNTSKASALPCNVSSFIEIFTEVLTGKEFYHSTVKNDCKKLLQGIAKSCFETCNEVDAESKMLTILDKYEKHFPAWGIPSTNYRAPYVHDASAQSETSFSTNLDGSNHGEMPHENDWITHPGSALYDFIASTDVELNLTAGEEVEIEYEVEGWFHVTVGPIHNGGSILDVLEDMVKVGQSMGYNLEGCMKDIEGLGHKSKKEWIKELNYKHKVNFLALQETKLERVTHMDVKLLWGNSNYQFIASDSVGSSGGILCVWEANVFRKDYATVSDNFLAIYGTWLPNNSKILLVVIYAPQQISQKRVLWDYISSLLGRWDGEAIIMGDFNDVRCKEERLGSLFNSLSARVFNRFIESAGLVEVKLEGYSFTWSHPSAAKMSKLDRFLVTDGILSLFPSITALCLDRHLSDHRPILLHEVHTDFGPIPFRFYHSWFRLDGFDDMVEQAWRSFSHSDSNGMIRFKKKLQDLKIIIRRWVKDRKSQQFGVKNSLISELGDIDKALDHGNVSDTVLLKRMELMHQLQDINMLEARESLQKSKIKWADKCDEKLKNSFMKSFQARFKQPYLGRFKLNSVFTNRLSPDQVVDLDSNVSRDEIRKAVWDCGENKSPSSDGYTF